MPSFVTHIRTHGLLGFRRPLDFVLIGATALVNVTLWAATGLVIQAHDQIVPLHYTIYFGIDLTGSANQLFLLPAFGLVVWISHLVAARAIRHDAWRTAWLVMALTIELLVAAIVAAIAYVSLQA